jgi:PAS domain S-box-containing protein
MRRTIEDSGTRAPSEGPPATLGREEWTRLLVDSVPDYAIFTLDKEGRITTWNDGARRMMGFAAEEVVGRPVSILYPPGEEARAAREMEKALAHGRCEEESWHVRRDGSRIWVDEVMTPLRADDGTHRGFAKVSRDLSEKRQAEERLRASEERLRLVVESVRDYAILTLDTAGVVDSWNVGAERIFGFAPCEILGRPGDIIFTPEDRARSVPEEEQRQARENGRAEDERWHVRGDGRRVYVSGVMAPLCPEGVVTGYVKVARDLTERKHLDDALRQAHEEAQQANRAKDEFLAMLGHELRNPLAPMVSALEVMRLGGIDSPAQGILERQVAHLTRLVDDLLDVSRIMRGKIELARRPIELREIVDRALELTRPLLRQRRNQVAVRVEQRGLVLDADPDRIAQVISNLVTNASKYSDAGSRIGLSASREARTVRIEVEDEGIGIGAEMIESVFEPFVQQPQSLERKLGGLGLGLAIVRSLVDAHGGTVRAESAGRGRGSTFVLQLPAASGGRDGTRPGPEPATLAASGGGRRVLIVDDNTDAAQMLKDGLEGLGYVVEAAYEGPAALERARIFQPAVVLLDIGLPGMDGYEVARALRSTPEGSSGVRIFALTGYGQPADRRRTSEAGFDVHLVKPVSLSRLQQLLEEDVPTG